MKVGGVVTGPTTCVSGVNLRVTLRSLYVALSCTAAVMDSPVAYHQAHTLFVSSLGIKNLLIETVEITKYCSCREIMELCIQRWKFLKFSTLTHASFQWHICFSFSFLAYLRFIHLLYHKSGVVKSFELNKDELLPTQRVESINKNKRLLTKPGLHVSRLLSHSYWNKGVTLFVLYKLFVDFTRLNIDIWVYFVAEIQITTGSLVRHKILGRCIWDGDGQNINEMILSHLVSFIHL